MSQKWFSSKRPRLSQTSVAQGFSQAGAVRRRPFRKNARMYQTVTSIARSIDRRVFPLVQRINQTIQWNPNAGFNAVSDDITFCATQAGINYSQNGGAWNLLGFSNAGAQQATFSKYRIRKYEIEAFYSAFSNPQSAVAETDSLPLIYTVIDEENDTGLGSAAAALTYGNMKVLQFGSYVPGGGQRVTHNDPPTLLGADTTASFAGTIVAAVPKKKQWIACSNVNIQHGCHKWYGNPGGVAPNAVIGYFTLIHSVIFEYTGIE